MLHHGTVLILLLAAWMIPETTSARSSSGLMNNALLWKRLGLNRAIGGEGQPRISAAKKKGESTVYFIKLPPQPHYYIPSNYIPSGSDAADKDNSTPDPFETVSVDFTANGKPESVYHWNLPLGYTMPGTAGMTTTTTTTTTPASVYHQYKKPYFRQNFLNNGKPQKLYFVKPSLYGPSVLDKTTTTTTTTEEPMGSTAPPGRIGKPFMKKHHFRGNGKPNQLYFVKRAHFNDH